MDGKKTELSSAKEKNKTRSRDSCLLEQPHLRGGLLEAAERVCAGPAVGRPECQDPQLWPQSLTGILAEGAGRVPECLTRQTQAKGATNGVKSYISSKSEKKR